MRFFLILIIAILLGGFYSAGYAKNVIYIVVEGVSRDTLYPLIKKNHLWIEMSTTDEEDMQNLSSLFLKKQAEVNVGLHGDPTLTPQQMMDIMMMLTIGEQAVDEVYKKNIDNVFKKLLDDMPPFCMN